jgi:ATP-dependent DNA ligase
MLASSISEWPRGEGWALEPKYDGYRLDRDHARRRVCGWSRHGTSLTDPLGRAAGAVFDARRGWVFDGELIALDEQDDGGVQSRHGLSVRRCSRIAFPKIVA